MSLRFGGVDTLNPRRNRPCKARETFAICEAISRYRVGDRRSAQVLETTMSYTTGGRPGATVAITEAYLRVASVVSLMTATTAATLNQTGFRRL